MRPCRYNMYMSQSDSFAQYFVIHDENDNPVDLTDYTSELVLYTYPGGEVIDTWTNEITLGSTAGSVDI